MTEEMKEARRWPGSEWLKDRPAALETVYNITRSAFIALYPGMRRISPNLAEKLIIWSEKGVKGYLFNCQMCGQCILHSTGMTCPMNCPKNLRNGPCGGVRQDGHCEVIPEMKCVWTQAWERDQKLNIYEGEIILLQPPVNRELQDSAAWINMYEGSDTQTPPGWVDLNEIEVNQDHA